LRDQFPNSLGSERRLGFVKVPGKIPDRPESRYRGSGTERFGIGTLKFLRSDFRSLPILSRHIVRALSNVKRLFHIKNMSSNSRLPDSAQDEEMASPRHSADNPTGGPGDAPALPPGDYGPGFNAWGQPSSHGRLGPRYASHSYRGPVYELPTRLDVPPLDDSRRRNRISYDQAPPMGAPVGEGGPIDVVTLIYKYMANPIGTKCTRPGNCQAFNILICGSCLRCNILKCGNYQGLNILFPCSYQILIY
jgi:hypothetical protein